MPCYVINALSQPLEPDPLDPGQVIAGDPQVSALPILDGEELAVGIWEHSAGESTDVEADEVFVVVSGRATVEVDGGPTLELAPGVVGVLAKGARTTWTVHEPLRKVFQITMRD
jgi:uncharacterized cupin superfamily protein